MTNDDEVLALYLKEINNIPLLTREEEEALAVKAANGDKLAKNKIINANLRFVVNVAKKYKNHGIDLVDLISEGNIGLMTAIDHFDVTKGYHFISYAVWWIRQCILKAICEKSRAIRLPLNRVNELVKIEHARKLLVGKKTEEEEIREIADMLNMDASHVREMLAISQDMISLDSPVHAVDDGAAEVGDTLEDKRYGAPEQQAITKAMRSDIDNAMSSLRPSEQRVLRLRYGFDGEKPMSLKEVGDRCNLTKERIRQIEKHAIVRMQHPRRLQRLAAYIA